jgi:hypothetical protein
VASPAPAPAATAARVTLFLTSAKAAQTALLTLEVADTPSHAAGVAAPSGVAGAVAAAAAAPASPGARTALAEAPTTLPPMLATLRGILGRAARATPAGGAPAAAVAAAAPAPLAPAPLAPLPLSLRVLSPCAVLTPPPPAMPARSHFVGAALACAPPSAPASWSATPRAPARRLLALFPDACGGLVVSV